MTAQAYQPRDAPREPHANDFTGKMAPSAVMEHGVEQGLHLSPFTKASTVKASVLHGPRDLRVVSLHAAFNAGATCFFGEIEEESQETEPHQLQKPFREGHPC